jgi:hypothetical protein
VRTLFLTGGTESLGGHVARELSVRRGPGAVGALSLVGFLRGALAAPISASNQDKVIDMLQSNWLLARGLFN